MANDVMITTGQASASAGHTPARSSGKTPTDGSGFAETLARSRPSGADQGASKPAHVANGKSDKTPDGDTDKGRTERKPTAEADTTASNKTAASHKGGSPDRTHQKKPAPTDGKIRPAGIDSHPHGHLQQRDASSSRQGATRLSQATLSDVAASAAQQTAKAEATTRRGPQVHGTDRSPKITEKPGHGKKEDNPEAGAAALMPPIVQMLMPAAAVSSRSAGGLQMTASRTGSTSNGHGAANAALLDRLHMIQKQLLSTKAGTANTGQQHAPMNGGATVVGPQAGEDILQWLVQGAGPSDHGASDSNRQFATLFSLSVKPDDGSANAAMAGLQAAASAPSPAANPNNAPAAGTTPQPGTQTTLSGMPGTATWNQALGQQTLHLGQAGTSQAQLQLHPRELGQINISISVDHQNQTQIHFAATHAHVRDAVESALPQLRQALAAGGLSLGQTSVGDQNSQAAFTNSGGSSNPGGGNGHASGGPGGDDIGTDVPSVVPATRPSPRPGGIDLFA